MSHSLYPLPSSSGFHLPAFDIALDVNAAVASHCFVTHAHADHVPRDRRMKVYATPNTAALMRIRGFVGDIHELPFYEKIDLHNAQVSFYPAGHILGSAMVYVESDEGTLLYTGDCRRPAAPTSEGFVSPESVDVLITEATFGLPIYRWASHEELFDQVRRFAFDALNANETPIFYAYNLGKAQEILHALAPTGIRAQIHGGGYPLCKVYTDAGIDLGRYEKYDKNTLMGAALIAPLSAEDQPMVTKIPKARQAYVSGWASNESRRQQLNVDALIPLSDHIDFYDLIDWVTQLRPKRTYITHSPTPEVVCHFLQREGLDAVPMPQEYG
jgi:putative mRNA 3-end processing factor